ncbi:MAG: hypothetical protein ACSHYB_05345 [Roseibacillus sp.]
MGLIVGVSFRLVVKGKQHDDPYSGACRGDCQVAPGPAGIADAGRVLVVVESREGRLVKIGGSTLRAMLIFLLQDGSLSLRFPSGQERSGRKVRVS